MKLLSRIASFFRVTPPAKRIEPTLSPQLRNRPGGMAWIKGVGCMDNGTEVLNGRAVCTVQLAEEGMWHIDPPQPVRLVVPTQFRSGDAIVPAGKVITVTRIHDNCLEPWRDVSDDDRDEALDFQPTVPYGREISIVSGWTRPVTRPGGSHV